MERWLKKRTDLTAVAVLATAVLLFFWPVVTGQAWLPKGGGDLVSFLYPMYRFAAQSLHDGQIPLWNPYLYAGAPLVADNQSGLFYPFNLLLFLLNPDFSYRTMQALVIWHFFFAGLTTYLCLRLWRPLEPVSPIAALLGALTFAFSDVFITHIGNLNLNAVMTWLPLALLGLHRATLAAGWRQRLAWALGGGTAVGLSTLAGHGQMTFMLALFLGLYALYRAAAARSLVPILLLGVVGLSGIGLAAISLLPALEQIPHTLRAEFDSARAANYSLPWRGLVGLLAPDFYGRGIGRFWGSWERVEVGYAGIVPWLLTLTATPLLRQREKWFWVGAGLFCLLLALGGNTPLFGWLLSAVPVVPFQVPARFLLLTNFALAMLAAFALDEWWRNPPDQRTLLATAVILLLAALLLILHTRQLLPLHPERSGQMWRAVAVFAALALAGLGLLLARQRGWLPAHWLGPLLLALLLVDLIGLGRYAEIEWNDPTPGFAADSPALAFLQADPGIHRVDITTDAWQPSLPQLYGLYGARGVFNPLAMANYNVYMGSVGFRGSTLYNLLGVKYLVGGKTNPPGDTSFIVPVFEDDPAVTVYLNTRALPRGLVVYSAEVVPDHDAVFALTHRHDFDPRRLIYVEGGRPLQQQPGQATITITRYDLNEATFTVTTDHPAYFFLSDVYHPHWRASVSGEEVPVEIANYAFRAVYVDAGVHDIRFWFDPPGWRWGLGITAVTLLLLLAFTVWFWQKNGQAPTVDH